MGRKWWIWCKCIATSAVCTAGNYEKSANNVVLEKLYIYSLPSWKIGTRNGFQFFLLLFSWIKVENEFRKGETITLLYCYYYYYYHKRTLLGDRCGMVWLLPLPLPALHTHKCPQLVGKCNKARYAHAMQTTIYALPWNEWHCDAVPNGKSKTISQSMHPSIEWRESGVCVCVVRRRRQGNVAIAIVFGSTKKGKGKG